MLQLESHLYSKQFKSIIIVIYDFGSLRRELATDEIILNLKVKNLSNAVSVLRHLSTELNLNIVFSTLSFFEHIRVFYIIGTHSQSVAGRYP